MKQKFTLLRGEERAVKVAKISTVLNSLSTGISWDIEISKHVRRRSDSQNAYLWGVVYPTILSQEALSGWAAEDLHEYFLGEHFGWKTLTSGHVSVARPKRRSSGLSTVEFLEYVAFIQQRMATLSVYVPDPNEHFNEPETSRKGRAVPDPSHRSLQP